MLFTPGVGPPLRVPLLRCCFFISLRPLFRRLCPSSAPLSVLDPSEGLCDPLLPLRGPPAAGPGTDGRVPDVSQDWAGRQDRRSVPALGHCCLLSDTSGGALRRAPALEVLAPSATGGRLRPGGGPQTVTWRGQPATPGGREDETRTSVTGAENNGSFEWMISIRESFDSCHSSKRLRTSRLHEFHEAKLPFASHIEFIRLKLSLFSALVTVVLDTGIVSDVIPSQEAVTGGSCVYS